MILSVLWLYWRLCFWLVAVGTVLVGLSGCGAPPSVEDFEFNLVRVAFSEGNR